MKSIRRTLKALAHADLCVLSQAIDREVQRRREIFTKVPDTLRCGVVQREQGDGPHNETAVLLLRGFDLGAAPLRRRAA